MNIFTNDDYRRIQAWLKANAIKDSDLVQSETTIPDEDILTIVQKVNGIPTNFKINIKDFLNSSLNKIIIELFTVNAIKVNNSLVVDIDKIIINEEENLTLQAIFDSFNNQLNDVSSASKGWNIEYQAPSIDEPTVRAKYVLKDYKGVPKGDPIKVYKDSAITNVYLGTTEDTCNENTGEVTKKPVQNNNEALSIVYRLDTGKYSLVNIPIGIFIKEAEFDKYRGLGITENGQVFIKLASDIESSNYLHFNASGEISADGIENRILQDLGTIINSVAGDDTMWGQYKKEEGTKDSAINDSSRWGQYKQAEATRNERLNNLENKIEEVKQKIIYNVSAHNSGAVFESLSALLNSSDLNTLIPTSVRHGGMTIKFIQGSEQSSDNKYVQYRLMNTTWSTTVSDWQGVDDEPTAGSHNLVTSGGVAQSIDGIIQHEVLEEVPNEILITDDEDNEVLDISPDGVNAKNLKSNGKDVLTTDVFTEDDEKKLELLGFEEILESEDNIIITDDEDDEVLNISSEGVDAKNLKTNGKDVLVEQSVTYISVASDGTKDFTSIQEALNSITDASKNNRYQIDVYTDEIITQRSQLWEVGNYENITQRVGNRDVYGVGFMTKDYVDIVGIGNVTVGVVLSRSEIEGYKGANIVPVHMRKNAMLKNLHIVSQNTRYTIHTEVGTGGDNVNATQIIEDCIIDYLGNPDAAYFSDHWSSGCPWGCGLLSGQTCIFRGCIIKGDARCVCHTNSNFANPASVIFEKCEWVYYGGGINFNEYGSNVHNNVRFIDCIMPPFFSANPSIRNNIVNAWTNIWNIEIRRCTPCAIDINNWSNDNFLYNTKVHVMKFVTADEGSIIKVVGGTAKDLIYGENYVLSRKTTTNGYCAGTLLIGDNKNSQDSYKFALGNRLGDCSVTNKTLIVEVIDSNGNTSQHTITFGNNYGGDSSAAPLISQSSILSEINSQLTDIAVCSVNIPQNFPYGDKYYLVRNKGSEKILEGMGVVFDYTLGVASVRVATSADGHIDGIALEDIPVYASYDKNMYKVIKKGDYLCRYQSGSPKIANKWEEILGVMYKIGSTDGNFVHTNNINEACLIGISDYLFKII